MTTKTCLRWHKHYVTGLIRSANNEETTGPPRHWPADPTPRRVIRGRRIRHRTGRIAVRCAIRVILRRERRLRGGGMPASPVLPGHWSGRPNTKAPSPALLPAFPSRWSSILPPTCTLPQSLSIRPAALYPPRRLPISAACVIALRVCPLRPVSSVVHFLFAALFFFFFF